MSTIYLIDDEPDMLDLLCEVARQSGFQTQIFTEASQFFNVITLIEPGSIMVLDLDMPAMDGIEVMRRLSKMENTPEMILISGHDVGVLHSAQKLGRAQSLKMLANFSKPVNLNEFQNLLLQHNPENKSPQVLSSFSKQDIEKDELQRAIKNDELVLHYQPQMEFKSGKLIGVEALIRWQHVNKGLIYPDQFLPLAEQNTLMQEMTDWIIERVVQQAKKWNLQGLRLRVSVNISAENIISLSLPEKLIELLLANQQSPTLLTLEVTESALMGELVTSLDILTRLRLKGFGLSIDDFGTGYSSLVQLHRIPFTELKIDQSFVANILEDDEARAIVKTCIILAHELGMHVVAEGIEDQKTWDMLKKLNCDIAQGYFIARPMHAQKLMAWAEEKNMLIRL